MLSLRRYEDSIFSGYDCGGAALGRLRPGNALTGIIAHPIIGPDFACRSYRDALCDFAGWSRPGSRRPD